MTADETKAPAGSAGRRRRPGGKAHRGTLVRLPDEIHAALEAEARETGQSKVGIIETALRRRYRIRAAA